MSAPTPRAPLLLQAAHLTKTFGAFVAVDDVSFSVAPGEVVGLLGANAAGKTTALRIALGLLAPTSGTALLLGRYADRGVRQRIGYVPQGLGLYADMSVLENLQFVAAVYGGAKPEVPESLASVGDDLVGEISLGSQRELAFACALLHEPELIILDEPTSGVGALTRAAQSMLATGDQFERLQVTMTALMGSLREGEAATAWVKQFAKDTPHQVTEVTDAFIKLKGFGLDPMDGTLQAIVHQNAKLGKGTENLTGITLALGQAWAKQKLQGEEIMQLVERGVPVWDLLGQATGRTTAEIQAMSEAGARGRDTIAALIKAMGAGSTGAAAANMSLLSGYVSNLKDEWAEFQDAVAQAGAMAYAKETLAGLLQTIARMKADGSLQPLAERWSAGFVAVGQAVVGAARTIAGLADELALLARAWAALKVAEWAGVLGRAAAGFTLIGTGDVMPNGQEGQMYPGRVTIVVHPPIPTDGADADAVCDAARRAVASALPPELVGDASAMSD